MPPPVPPSVNDGRMTAGKPMLLLHLRAPPRGCARSPERAEPSPMRVIASLNISRSSALSIAFFDAPISSTSNLSSTPSRARSSAQLSAVCPPIVGSSASGRSRSMILRDHRPGDRLDVGDVGQLRVGHDRRRVRVHEDDPVALLAQRLARLRARVVELARLPDDDRAGADDQDRLDVGAFRHVGTSSFHHLHEAVEQIAEVVRPGARLGMPLEAERRAIGARDPLQAAVEQRHVRDAHVCGRASRRRRRSRDSGS